MNNQPNNSYGRLASITLTASGILFALVLVATLFNSPAVHAQLESWKVIPTPQRFTELYFDNSKSIPSVAPTGHVTFAFSIHNVEGKSVTYPYTVSLNNSTGTGVALANGNVLLSDGSTATVPEAIALPKGVKTGEITVYLPDQHQEIDFWLGAKQ